MITYEKGNNDPAYDNCNTGIGSLKIVRHTCHPFKLGNGISDVSPLAGLTRLEQLGLSNNQIRGVSLLLVGSPDQRLNEQKF